MFYTIFVVLLSISCLITVFANNSEVIQNCVCVPYWQCKEDYSEVLDTNLLSTLHMSTPSNPVTTTCHGDFDVCCKIGCGRRSKHLIKLSNRQLHLTQYKNFLKLRILGDKNEAEFGEFPWMLGILYNRTYRCGASLIHPQVALTAAHCVSEDVPYKFRAGEWDFESKIEPIDAQDRIAQKILIHPLYHPESLQNDIALVILNSPFQLTDNVGVICLPPQGILYDYKRCLVTGWGKNAHQKKYQSTLKKVDLPVMPRELCTRHLQDARLGPQFQLHRSFICAGGEDGKDSCKGDGGGPLMCPIDDKPGRYEQIGIVSWGLTCGLHSAPGVYVNVALFNEWIDFEMIRHNFDIYYR